jgi:hypothetical protein
MSEELTASFDNTEGESKLSLFKHHIHHEDVDLRIREWWYRREETGWIPELVWS